MRINLVNKIEKPAIRNTDNMFNGEFGLITGNGSRQSSTLVGQLVFKGGDKLYLITDCSGPMELCETYPVEVLGKQYTITITVENSNGN